MFSPSRPCSNLMNPMPPVALAQPLLLILIWHLRFSASSRPACDGTLPTLTWSFPATRGSVPYSIWHKTRHPAVQPAPMSPALTYRFDGTDSIPRPSSHRYPDLVIVQVRPSSLDTSNDSHPSTTDSRPTNLPLQRHPSGCVLACVPCRLSQE